LNKCFFLFAYIFAILNALQHSCVYVKKDFDKILLCSGDSNFDMSDVTKQTSAYYSKDDEKIGHPGVGWYGGVPGALGRQKWVHSIQLTKQS
jgi:hypothetical protein